MKRHLTASTERGRQGEGSVALASAPRPRSIPKVTRTEAQASASPATLSSVNAWTHTLMLEGSLSRCSAHALEMELDRLCEEGVTGITLDLRGLSSIDSVGAAVIAFRCRLCERRGYDFALIPGARSVHRVFEGAGLAGALPFREHDEGDPAKELQQREPEEVLVTPRLHALALGAGGRDDCEQ